MQQASKEVSLAQLLEDVDRKITYGGARKISEIEEELLNQIEESYAVLIEMQQDLKYQKKAKETAQEKLNKTDEAINKYCSETTRNKILLMRGLQISPEEIKKIQEALSDKELLERTRENGEQSKHRYRHEVCCYKCNS